MMLDRVRTQLEFTNDTDWDAVSPLVQKVIDAQMAAGAGGRGGFGGRGGRGGRGGAFTPLGATPPTNPLDVNAATQCTADGAKSAHALLDPLKAYVARVEAAHRGQC